MKRKSLFLIVALNIGLICSAGPSSTYGSIRGTNVVINKTNSKGDNRLCLPLVDFNIAEQSISIDFGSFPIENFRVTISSPYNDVDYVVFNSFVSIPLEVDGVSDYQIVIETNDGDIFEGTLFAEDYQR